MKNRSVVIIIVLLVIVAGGAFAYWYANKTVGGKTVTDSPAVSNSVLITKSSSSLGDYLADPSGRALYTYSGDTTGVSNCTGTCLATWPGYYATGSTSNLPTGVSTLTRSDNGKAQYTYNGMPLYYFVTDAAGHVTGNGVSGFSVAKPSQSSAATPTPSSAYPTPTPTSAGSGSSSGSGW